MSTLEPGDLSYRACDEHAHCLCGGLMSFDSATGGLVCDDCRVRALADRQSWEPAEVAS